MNIVVLGLSVTSSWGNGHATSYRALLRGLATRGHDALFLERNVPWYASNRDLRDPPYCRAVLYDSVDELTTRHADAIAQADLVMVGSYVPDGIAVIDAVLARATGCTAFYDLDTPVTMAALEHDASDHLARRQVPAFDLYLSFSGGPVLERVERRLGARRARPLYCSVDLAAYSPAESVDAAWDLGYLGTYSDDRHAALDLLLVESARGWPEGRFIVAGAQYPDTIAWPGNVERVEHIAPGGHRAFYNRQRFTLNVTRRAMVAAGYSPSVRIFEAAACATPIISDEWPGLDTILRPGREIVVARGPSDVLACVRDMPEAERALMGSRARARIVSAHTGWHRAAELEQYVAEAGGGAAARSGGVARSA